MPRIIVTFVGGSFWITDNGSKEKVPAEHARNRETLEEYAESKGEDISYNFPNHLFSNTLLSSTKEVQDNTNSLLSLDAPKKIVFVKHSFRDVPRAPKERKRAVLVCLHCKQMREVPLSYKESGQKYCSTKCCGDAIRARSRAANPLQTVSCNRCGKEFERASNKIRPGQAIFCTRNCAYNSWKENPVKHIIRENNSMSDPTNAAVLSSITLESTDMIRIAEKFLDHLKTNKAHGTLCTMVSILQTCGAPIAARIREIANIETAIQEYKNAFKVDTLTKRDMLIVCNGGSVPHSPEALKLAEERYKLYTSSVASKRVRAKRTTKATPTTTEE